MSRSTQFAGLSISAIDYLNKNVSVVSKLPPMWEHQRDNLYKEECENSESYDMKKIDKESFNLGFEFAVERFAPKVFSAIDVPGVNTVTGMFDEDVHRLQRYFLKGGSYIDEYVQAEPWSSGPVIFLALMDCNGNPIQETLWSEDEINNA